jgi:hypothetical protein
MKIMEGVELDPKEFREQAGLVPRFPGLLTEAQKTLTSQEVERLPEGSLVVPKSDLGMYLVRVPGGVAPITILPKQAGGGLPDGEGSKQFGNEFDLIVKGRGKVPTHSTAVRLVTAWVRSLPVPRRESRLSEAAVWDSERFCDAVQKQAKAKIGNKYLHCDHYNQFNDKHDHVIITFVNLEGRPVGASAMNNRTQFTVDGFAAQLGQDPPTGKVKVKQLSGFVGKQAGLKFRAKTGTPEQIVKYLVDYIGQLAELEPKS